MPRICINVPDKMAAALKEKQVLTGVPVSEQIRRAINMSLYADQPVRKTERQPVIFVPQNRETR
jgi:hypothetical protein